MRIGGPTETRANESRVPLIPADAARLVKGGHELLVQAGAGRGAHFLDDAYTNIGAKIVPDAATLYGSSQIVLKVQKPTSAELALMPPGTVLIGFLWPLINPDLVREL